MKNFKYIFLIILFMIIGINGVSAKEQNIASCTYEIPYGTTTASIKFLVKLKEGFISTSVKLEKSYENIDKSDVVYNIDDDLFTDKYDKSASTFSNCPTLNFGIFYNKDEGIGGEHSYITINSNDDSSVACTGTLETGYECKSQSSNGKLEILNENTTQKDTKTIYCTNTYTDSELGEVTAEAYSENGTNYFALYDSNGNLLGSSTPGSYFKVGEKYYTTPNDSSMYKTGCESSNLVLTSNVDKTENEDENKPNIVDPDYKEGCEIFGDSLVSIIKEVYGYFKWIIPVLVVILSMLDFIKVIASGKDDDMKKAENNLVKRIILAVIFFLVPALISFLIRISGITEQFDNGDSIIEAVTCILK